MKNKIGIYWVVNGEVLSYVDEITCTESVIYDSRYSHYQEWQKLEIAKGVECCYYPRGRVIYDNINHSHLVYIDECIRDEDLSKILAVFGIKDNYNIVYAEHYYCDKCML